MFYSTSESKVGDNLKGTEALRFRCIRAANQRLSPYYPSHVMKTMPEQYPDHYLYLYEPYCSRSEHRV